MLFVVLAQNEFGLRDAWYVNGNDTVEAMSEASKRMIAAGICPETVTVLPAKDSRTVPYMFPNDPATDAELVLDFLRGYTRTVRLNYRMICELEEENSTEAEQGEEHLTEEPEAHVSVLARMTRFLHEDASEPISEE